LVPLGVLAFHRTYELEADRFGLELAAWAGYDAAAFDRYVQRAHPPDSELSPLPARELRLARIRETVASLPQPAPARAATEFRRVREIVRSMVEPPAQHRVPTLRR
jgi:predicted Zn-dependent protease